LEEKMQAKKILVTGGLGFIGAHTCVELANAGYIPLIVDNLSNSQYFIKERIEKIIGQEITFYEIDICDATALENVWKIEGEIEAVIHFAAYKAVGESVEFPLKYYRNNIDGLLSVLTVMQKQECRKIVFSSSCTVYGVPEVLPISENTPLQSPLSPYGATKQMCEQILRDVVKISNLKSVLLRYFNPVGAHPSALIGELPLGIPNNLVPFITQTAIGKRENLKIFGNDYPTPDGTAIRDYIHVVDLANAHVKSLQLMDKEADFKIEVINLGTGKGSSVLEVVQTFEAITQEKLNYVFAPRRLGDVPEIYAENKFAQKRLNWHCHYNLEEMMEHAWAWEKSLAGKN
jgi:UDP-glucose 4-epimerase